VGKRAKNIELSSARAWSVYSYLVKKGIEPGRLKPKGYGPDRPVAPNTSISGRAQNRRVEIIILKKD
jgi:outer membrane protein OmpA-like peptidoglycan-associated protein